MEHGLLPGDRARHAPSPRENAPSTFSGRRGVPSAFMPIGGFEAALFIFMCTRICHAHPIFKQGAHGVFPVRMECGLAGGAASSGLLSIELLRLLQDGAPASKPSPRGGLAAWQQKRVMDFIEEHLSEDVSLDVLADLVRLSPYHFLRSFKQSFGEPPYRYWTGRRIERAKALLANPRTSVTEIALDVGFHGTSAFSATFHRVTGQTPTDYRRDLE